MRLSWAQFGHKRIGRLLDNFVRPQEEPRRDRQPQDLGGLEVDDQLELGGLLDGEISRLGGTCQ
jgi:hypothetical protein